MAREFPEMFMQCAYIDVSGTDVPYVWASEYCIWHPTPEQQDEFLNHTGSSSLAYEYPDIWDLVAE